jgi:hypothetical protein
LEINSNPDLTSTTSITDTICPQLLKDSIKVLIDRVQNSKAPTGDFELVHSVPISRFLNQNIELGINGKKVLPPVKIKRNIYRPYVYQRRDLVIQGKTVSIQPSEDDFKESKPSEKHPRKVSFQLNPLKLYRTPRNPRKNFRSILVKPPYVNASYINKLPLNCVAKKMNLYDLLRCLSI